MSTEQQQQNHNEIEKALINNAKSIADNTKQEIENNNNKQQVGDHLPQPFIVKIEKARGSFGMRLLSFLPILISLAALYMTVRSFSKTSRAVEISDANLQDSRKKDSIAAIKMKIDDSLKLISLRESRLKDSTSNSINQKFLETQLNSIKETELQFNKAYRAYLQISELEFVTFKPDSFLIFKYYVDNLGYQPAILLKKRASVKASNRSPDSVLASFNFEKIKQTDIVNFYVRNKPSENIFISDNPIPRIVYEDLKNRVRFLYFYGEFLYQNAVTEKYSIYKFCIAVNMTGEKIASMTPVFLVYNKNDDIEDKSEFDKNY